MYSKKTKFESSEVYLPILDKLDNFKNKINSEDLFINEVLEECLKFAESGKYHLKTRNCQIFA